MAQRATSLGPKPSKNFLFLFFWVFLFVFVICFFCVLEGLRVRSSLGTKPSLFNFCFVLFFRFLSLLFSLFWPPPFSISLSLSLSSSCLSFFLLIFLFCFLLFPCFCLFRSLSFFFAFASWKEQHQNIKLQSFPSSIFSLFWFPVLFSLWNPFFLSLPFFFLILSYVFLFNINVFGFKKAQVQEHQFLVKRGVAPKQFLWTCEKLSFFGGPFFGQLLVDVQKHYISAHF